MRRVLPLVIGVVLLVVAIAVTAALWPALPARTLPTLPVPVKTAPHDADVRDAPASLP